jgi:hypothetical protein
VVPDRQAGDPDLGLADSARRLGPLPYSAAGPGPAHELPPPAELAAWTADRLDEIWFAEGCPDPFTYVEVGARDGGHARELLGLGPCCLDALRIVLVEPDPRLREREAANLSVESPAFTLGPVARSEDPDEGSRAVPGVGPLVTSLAEPPVLAGASVAVLIALGWLSRLPADVFTRRDGVWTEVRLAAPAGEGPGLEEMALPASPDRAADLDRIVPNAEEGARYRLEVGASRWLQRALTTAEHGWLLALDMWTERTEPAREGEPSSVALEPLAAIRRPQSGIEPVSGVLSVVRWRLG